MTDSAPFCLVCDSIDRMAAADNTYYCHHCGNTKAYPSWVGKKSFGPDPDRDTWAPSVEFSLLRKTGGKPLYGPNEEFVLRVSEIEQIVERAVIMAVRHERAKP